MTTTVMTPEAPAAPAARPPGFRQTLAAEWIKLWTLRSTFVMLALAVALSVGFSAFLAFVVGATWDQAPPQQRATFDPVTMSLAGGLFSGVIFASLGVLSVTGEYAGGLIRATLTATPRRGRVLAAKALNLIAVLLPAGLVVVGGMFLAVQAVLAIYDLPTASLGDPEARRLVLGVALATPAMPLIGAALGFLLRSTAGAVATVLGIMFVPPILGATLPDWWQEHVLRYLPNSAIDSLAQAAPPEGSLTYLSTGQAALVVAAWLLAFLGAAHLSLTRRDA